jgi:hypothetical protein
LEIPSAEASSWNIAERKSEENIQLIRYRPELEPFLGSSNYPRRLVIIWEYEPDNSSGMPSNDLSDEMRKLEDALVSELDPDRSAILTFVLTNYGCREWHFYVNEIQEISSRINSSLSELPEFPISLQIEDDPNWEEMRAVYNICK